MVPWFCATTCSGSAEPPRLWPTPASGTCWCSARTSTYCPLCPPPGRDTSFRLSGKDLLRPIPALDFDMADKHCAILLICAKLKELQWRMKSADLIKPTRPDCQTKLAESIISNIFVLFPELHRAIASGWKNTFDFLQNFQKHTIYKQSLINIACCGHHSSSSAASPPLVTSCFFITFVFICINKKVLFLFYIDFFPSDRCCLQFCALRCYNIQWQWSSVLFYSVLFHPLFLSSELLAPPTPDKLKVKCFLSPP